MAYLKSSARATLVHAGAPAAGTSEVQTITPSAATASGTFRLKFQNRVTAALAYNVSAADMQAALRALPSIGSDGCTVALNGGVYSVTFAGVKAKLAVPLIQVVASTVKDSGAAAVTLTVAEGTPGVDVTGRGTPVGSLLWDSTNKALYVNTGTELIPTWSAIAASAELTSLLAAIPVAAEADLASDANAATIVTKVNALLAKLRTAGIVSAS